MSGCDLRCEANDSAALNTMRAFVLLSDVGWKCSAVAKIPAWESLIPTNVRPAFSRTPDWIGKKFFHQERT